MASVIHATAHGLIAGDPFQFAEPNERVPMSVKVGDRVLYTKPWNDPVKIGGVEYYLVSESEILAVISQ